MLIVHWLLIQLEADRYKFLYFVTKDVIVIKYHDIDILYV